MADPRVIQNIKTAAAQTGADPAAMLATALTEDGARPGVVGDNGTSFGPFQFHVGGALGSHAPAWADSPAAYLNRAQEFQRLQVHGGKGAAAVQRPADPTGYAAKVQGNLAEARRLLGNAAPPAGPVSQLHSNPVIHGSNLLASLLADQSGGYVSPLQGILDSNAKLAGISSIQLPVATPIAPRATPAPVKVSQDAKGTGPVDATGQAIVNVARKYLGVPYLWGGTTKNGLDCSGLLQLAAKQAGVSIPRTTYQQIKVGQPIPTNQIQPGDAVFFGTASNPHHVGIAIGGGRFIEAPHSGSHVRISTLAGRKDFLAARRYA